MSTTEDSSPPEFFKVYVNHHSSDRMLIPYEFTEHLGGINGGAVWLTGANGEKWAVELVRERDAMCFGEGWKVFVADNMIVKNDFMFFKYHGRLRFSVRIFDNESECEKILPLRANCGGGRGKRGFGRVEDQQVDVDRKLTEGSRVAGRRQRGPLLTVKEEELQMPRGVAEPYLIKKMTRHNISKFPLFRIPVSFTRKHSLKYKRGEKMIIRTKESSWTLNIVCNQSVYVLSGGWTAFVRDNNIEEGEIWVFKLVSRLEMVACHLSELSAEEQRIVRALV